MDPPIKLFGQTIAFTTSASSQDDALDGAGTTSSVALEELSSSPQDKTENSAESGGGDAELIQQAEGSTGVFPDLSSSGSSGGGDEERVSTSPREVYGLLQPPLSSETPMGGVTVSEGSDSLDGEDAAGGFRHGEEVDGEDQAGGKGGPKMPRRPDKAVACPRCNSLDTKFCYYNNYNVNQPRHFCKHCQRYWTAGGTLRNVPVGAGRRKNKHGSVVPPKQQSPDMGLVRGDDPDVAAPLLVVGKGVQLPVPLQVQQAGVGGSKPVVGVLPVAGCPSDGSIRMLPYGTIRVPSMEGTYIVTSADGEVKGVADTRGGAACNNLHCMPPAAYGNPGSHPTEMDHGNNCNWTASPDGPAGAGLSTATTVLQQSVKCESGGANLAKQQQHIIKGGGDGMMPEWGGGGVPGPPGGVAANCSFGFFNGGWPYGYNVGWSGGAAFCTAGGVASVGGNPGMPPPPPPPGVAAAWSSAAAAAGGMWTAGMPWSMPGLSWSPAGWGAPPPWSIGPWAMGPAAAGAPVAMSPAAPRTGDVSGLAARPMTCPPGGTPIPLAGGKHARAPDGAVWAPKSLKMADPEEAMRSSVWRILGVGSLPADVETPPASTTFKAFQPKSEQKKGVPNGDQQTVQATLNANPAAMSRSMYFHESN